MNKGEVEYINGILWPGPPSGHFIYRPAPLLIRWLPALYLFLFRLIGLKRKTYIAGNQPLNTGASVITIADIIRMYQAFGASGLQLFIPCTDLNDVTVL